MQLHVATKEFSGGRVSKVFMFPAAYAIVWTALIRSATRWATSILTAADVIKDLSTHITTRGATGEIWKNKQKNISVTRAQFTLRLQNNQGFKHGDYPR